MTLTSLAAKHNIDPESANDLPIGTRIRFIKTLDAPANEDHPAIVYARKGETGEITGHETKEGYWVKTDSWSASFGASANEFELIARPTLKD